MYADKLWNTFVELLTEMRDKKVVKKITVYTSIEGWRQRGQNTHEPALNFELLKVRTEQIAAMDDVRISIMSAFNILSITSFKSMLEWVLYLKKKYTPLGTSETNLFTDTGHKPKEFDSVAILAHQERNSTLSNISVSLDIPYLRSARLRLDVHFCTEDLFQDYLLDTIKFMANNVSSDIWSTEIGLLKCRT